MLHVLPIVFHAFFCLPFQQKTSRVSLWVAASRVRLWKMFSDVENLFTFPSFYASVNFPQCLNLVRASDIGWSGRKKNVLLFLLRLFFHYDDKLFCAHRALSQRRIDDDMETLHSMPRCVLFFFLGGKYFHIKQSHRNKMHSTV